MVCVGIRSLIYISSSNTCDMWKSVVVVGCSRMLVFVVLLSSVFILSFDCWMCLYKCSFNLIIIRPGTVIFLFSSVMCLVVSLCVV